jgi:alginate O-acetyltransferase complex protein AlgI
LSFTSLDFLVFLGLFLGFVHGTGNLSAQRWLLIIFSYLFYLSSGLLGVFVITFLSLVDFNVGRRLGTSIRAGTRRWWLWISLGTNLGALVFFKYSVFLAETTAPALSRLGMSARATIFYRSASRTLPSRASAMS